MDRDGRLILNMGKFGIGVFEEFGRYNYLSTQAILPTHVHRDTLEICYLAKGCQEYFVGEETFQVFGGDLFLTFPDEAHGTGEIPEEKGVLYWMSLKKPRLGEEYLGLTHAEASELFGKLAHLPVRLFKGNGDCERLLKRMYSVYFRDRGDLLVKTELQNLLVSFLLNVARCGEMASKRRYSKCILGAVGYIDENLFENLSIEQLAQRCNLSPSRFKHRFKEEAGIPPGEYIIRKKVEKARQLIEENSLSIKNIAYDLGFSSPAYFATVFKQYNGCAPSEYKARKGNT